MDRTDETVIIAPDASLGGGGGKLAGKALLCVVAGPYKQAGFITLPMASACLQMEGNDH